VAKRSTSTFGIRRASLVSCLPWVWVVHLFGAARDHGDAHLLRHPLGLPIALGPGTMATIIVYAQGAGEPSKLVCFYAGLVGYLAFLPPP